VWRAGLTFARFCKGGEVIAAYRIPSSGSGRGFRGGAQKLHQACSGCLSCPLLEEISGGFYHSHLLRHRRGNPVIQGDAIFFRQALRGLLDRDWKRSRISCLTHNFALSTDSFMMSQRGGSLRG